MGLGVSIRYTSYDDYYRASPHVTGTETDINEDK